METESRFVVVGGWGERMGRDCLMGVGFPFEVMKMLWSWMQAVDAQ